MLVLALAIFALFYFLFDCHYFIRGIFVIGINQLWNVCFGPAPGEITEESVQYGRTFNVIRVLALHEDEKEFCLITA